MRISTNNFGKISNLITGEVWSSEDLTSKVRERCSVLHALGIKPGSNVIIMHGGSPEFFADLFATWACGGCAVCINPHVSKNELEHIVEFIAPCAILTSVSGSGPTPSTAVPVLDLCSEQSNSSFNLREAIGSHLDDQALILFTSGTTGSPKGVVHSFRSLFSRIALNSAHLNLSNMRRTLCVLPTYFGHGLIGNCLTPLMNGADLLLAVEEGITGASKLANTLEIHQPTFMSSVPSFWKLVQKVCVPPKQSSLLQVNIGSAPLQAKLWKEVIEWTGCENTLNVYGITETANWISGVSALDQEPTDGIVGQMWGGSAAIKSETGEISPVGQGELLLQCPSMMIGYYKRDDLTQEILRDGWYHTGDTANIDSEGFVSLIGRRKNEINRGGYKIQPEEIDALLERHKDVVDVCTFGMPDELSGEIVAVAVTLNEGSEATSLILRDWCRQHIRLESVPERWYFIDEIPKNDRGKINRNDVMVYCTQK